MKIFSRITLAAELNGGFFMAWASHDLERVLRTDLDVPEMLVWNVERLGRQKGDGFAEGFRNGRLRSNCVRSKKQNGRLRRDGH
jgi:hypothetical protein